MFLNFLCLLPFGGQNVVKVVDICGSWMKFFSFKGVKSAMSHLHFFVLPTKSYFGEEKKKFFFVFLLNKFK
jgi:hypothetical protein